MTKTGNMSSEPDGKGKILKAAYSVFSRKGYTSASLEEVAIKGGVSKGLVVYHFKTKESLFLEVVKDYTNPLIERIRKVADSKESATEKLRVVTGLMERYSIKHDRMFVVSMHASNSLGGAIGRQFKEHRHIDEALRKILAAGIASGEFVIDNPDVAVYLWYGLMWDSVIRNGYGARTRKGNENHMLTRKTFDVLMKFLTLGYRTDARTASFPG